MSGHRFLALDYGAESGRAVLVTLREAKVKMEEFHRFPNRPIRLGDTLYWDFPFLFGEALYALRVCSDKGLDLDGIGIDTWGVDFGLLGQDGRLLSNPVHYRDQRTEGIHEYSNPIMSTEEIFLETALEPWSISSLFQLLAMKRAGSPILPIASTFLNMPDLFNYFLTGMKTSERSIASTGNLMGIDGEWSRKIIDSFNLPDMFVPLVEPGTVLGPPTEPVRKRTGLGDVPVTAVCGHDTASVAAAVPAVGERWAFLSCGTWSILGRVGSAPVATMECLQNGFTNEYTLGGWFTCRNILGLWLIQELKRKWDTVADPWGYDRMTNLAAEANSGPLLDVSHKSLLAPADMESSILELIMQNGGAKPASRGELVRGILESLALEYAYCLETLKNLTKEDCTSLFMVGGGVSNGLLCRFTANACGIPVYAGVEECTSVGNALVQATALGLLGGPNEIRQVVRNSFRLTTYEPEDTNLWMEKKQKYKEIKGLHRGNK